MYRKIKMNYMKLLLPLAAVLVGLGLLVLAVTGFDIRYGLMTSVPLETLAESELLGACAQIQPTQLTGTFARVGRVEEDDAMVPSMDVDMKEQFCAIEISSGKYMGVRIGGKDIELTKQFASAVNTFGIEEAQKLDLGVLRGTVNVMSDELYELFTNWSDEYIFGEEASDEEYAEVLVPYMLDINYYGKWPQGVVIGLTIFAGVLVALGLAVLISGFTGLWDKGCQTELKAAGRAKLEEEFKESSEYAKRLYLGKDHIWCFGNLFTDIFRTKDVVWAYARSRRLEGGKLTWYLVMKTGDKREYSAHLGEAANVQAAEEKLKTLVKPLCVGFDKEKQKLYDQDINTFKARVRKGTI